MVRTDFRGGGDALPGQKLATVNLMLSEASTAVVHLDSPVGELDELARRVIEALETLPWSTRPVERIRP